jgi:hypothetical protein
MGDIVVEPYEELRNLLEAELGRRFLPVNIAHSDGIPVHMPRFDPPRPGPRCDPHLAALWNGLFWGRPSGDAVARQHDPETLHGFRAASNAGAGGGWGGPRERSSNWSGAVALPGRGYRFSAASARWRVPQATRPAGENGPQPKLEIPPQLPVAGLGNQQLKLPDSWRCSIWVGLDGHRLLSDSLPQIGTTVIVDVDANGVERVRAHAWAQWWVRGKQYGEMRFDNFEVAPGDSVTAWLGMRSEDEVVLRIRNERTGKIGTAAWRSGAPPSRASSRTEQLVQAQIHAEPAPAEGAAAAWVVERPMVMFSHELFPLPRFEPVQFERCIAALRGPGDPLTTATALVDLRAARRIEMFRQRGRPYRTETCAAPALGAEADRLVLSPRPAGTELTPAA